MGTLAIARTLGRPEMTLIVVSPAAAVTPAIARTWKLTKMKLK